MPLNVRLYGAGLTPPQDIGEDTQPLDLEVDFVSLINKDTYGPPPLVAPSKDNPRPLAKEGDVVLYINTDLVPAFEIDILDD